MRAEIVSAYVLHARDYRDTSRIAELYSLEYGRISAVFKGTRTVGKRRMHILEPFRRLSVSVSGRGNLKAATISDTQRVFAPAPGIATYSGFYVNELLVRLVSEADANLDLFAAYEWVLARLQQADAVADSLRTFEALLLAYCGVGLDYHADANSDPIVAHRQYWFQADRGFVAISEFVDEPSYSGILIQDIASGRWHSASRLAAKNIQRAALQPLLGDKPLMSRQLLKVRSV